MSLLYDDPGYDTTSVRETLEHARTPRITQTSLLSMEPEGLYGTVYEDPRGTNILKIAVLVAVTIGLIVTVVFGKYLYDRISEANATPESVKDLSTQVIDVPIIADFVSYDDAGLLTALSSTYTMFQSSSDVTGETLVRLPQDIDPVTMATYSATGLGSLDIDQLAPLLKSAWFISTGRSGENTIKLKYADFSSGSVDKAIKNAIEYQGLGSANSSVLASGTDGNGNTYSYGTIAIDSGTWYWRVAACPLVEAYGNDQLPSDSVYVGVTVSSSQLMSVTTTADGGDTTAATV